jgi:molecular chaperone GrpE
MMKKRKTKDKEPLEDATTPEHVQDGATTETDHPPREQAGEAGSEEGEARADSVESLRAEVASLEDRLLRAKAEFQNFQRRSAVERAEAIRYANADLMRSLLGAIDDFERSLEAAEADDNMVSVIDGVRLVYENFMKALRQHGLERIDALHQPFDPHIHQAVMQQPSDEHAPGTVIEETKKGYRLLDRVVRPASVIVSKAVENEEDRASPAQTEETTERESARQEGESVTGA